MLIKIPDCQGLKVISMQDGVRSAPALFSAKTQTKKPKQTCLYILNLSNVSTKTPGALMIN